MPRIILNFDKLYRATFLRLAALAVLADGVLPHAIPGPAARPEDFLVARRCEQRTRRGHTEQ